MRRMHARRILRGAGNSWPINELAGSPPESWPGWPDNKRFALVLTHDVESQNGVDRVRNLAALEMEFGFRSSFNFIPEGGYSVPAELRADLQRDGFEVGVHDLRHDGRLYQSRREFVQNASRINHYVREWNASGFRSGFMLHNLDWLHELDIQYDASTFDTDPFEPQPEGRHTIFPFWVPEEQTDAASAGRGYVELPYTLPQDSTLFLLLGETTPDIWKRKVDWLAEHGGMVLLDTHPDYMSFDSSPRQTNTTYPASIYREFLSYVRDKYAHEYWHVLPRDVATHVRPRSASGAATAAHGRLVSPRPGRLRNRRGAVLLFSHYPADPRPRRAAEALVAEGVTIDVICLSDAPNEPRRETFGSVNVLRLPLRRHRAGQLSYIGQYSTFIVTCFAYLAARSVTRRYDFVHVHNMPDVLVFSALVPKLLGAKVILDLHDPMPELMQTIFKLPEDSLSVRVLKRLEKASISFADVVLTVNLACKKIYSSRSCMPKKIHVVLNAPDEEIFHFRAQNGTLPNGEILTQPFEILYHGSLVPRNGFDLAVDALELLQKRVPLAKLTVCGERTGYFDRVYKTVEQRGLAKSVQYLGPLDLPAIVELIDRCDLGIIPNHRNIFTEINTPTRIFEYLSLGKPVIAPKAPGIQDYFGARDLIYFELGDAKDLARQMEYAFSHPQQVAETIKRGQAVYLAHTWEREKRSFLKVVNDLV